MLIPVEYNVSTEDRKINVNDSFLNYVLNLDLWWLELGLNLKTVKYFVLKDAAIKLFSSLAYSLTDGYHPQIPGGKYLDMRQTHNMAYDGSQLVFSLLGGLSDE
jgi:hypothetical protein